MTASERDERDHRVAHQNREDLSTLLELRDIIDELGTILKLLEQQTATVKLMAQYFEDKGYGKVFIDSALSRLEDYRTQVTDMRENAHLAQKAVRFPDLNDPIYLTLGILGRKPPRPQAKASKRRRVPYNPLAGRSSPKPIAVCNGIHNLHGHVSHHPTLPYQWPSTSFC